MKPGGGRAKGAAFERAIVNTLKRIFPNAHRTAPMQAGHAGRYPDIGGCEGWWIEAGHGKRMDAAEKWGQANDDSEITRMQGILSEGHTPPVPIAITKRNGGQVLVTMAIEDWMELVGRGRE